MEVKNEKTGPGPGMAALLSLLTLHLAAAQAPIPDAPKLEDGKEPTEKQSSALAAHLEAAVAVEDAQRFLTGWIGVPDLGHKEAGQSRATGVDTNRARYLRDAMRAKGMGRVRVADTADSAGWEAAVEALVKHAKFTREKAEKSVGPKPEATATAIIHWYDKPQERKEKTQEAKAAK